MKSHDTPRTPQYAITADLPTLTAVAAIGQGYDVPGEFSFALRTVDGESCRSCYVLGTGGSGLSIPSIRFYF